MLQRVLAIAAALLLWQLVSLWVGQQFLLPSPFSVAARLTTIWREPGFWATIWHSFWRIVTGFLLALLLGTLLGTLSGHFRAVELLLEPFTVTVRSVPVASFIVIFLLWFSSDRLSLLIPLLMVFPVVYSNVLEGIRSVDGQLRECVQLYGLSLPRRLRFLWLPHLRPFLLSASGTGLGLAWKSGIAAEIIGTPAGSIGRMFYQAKVHFNTTDLFAWTVIVVLVSVLFEKCFQWALRGLFRRLYHD